MQHPIHADAEKSERPKSLWDIYLSFTLLALQGFGGVLAVAQREIVEKKRWLTNQEFVEDWAVAQLLPGPNVINLSLMIGQRHFGWRGAFSALLGMLSIPLVIVILLATVYTYFADHHGVDGALRGMTAVCAGLIAATAIKLMSVFKAHPIGPIWASILTILSFLLIVFAHAPLWAILLGLGGTCSLVVYFRLGAKL